MIRLLNAYLSLTNLYYTRHCISETCNVIEIKSGEMKACSFPFVYQGIKHEECTTFGSPSIAVENQELYWCSTNTNTTTYEHISGVGYWGFCHKTQCPSLPKDVLFRLPHPPFASSPIPYTPIKKELSRKLH